MHHRFHELFTGLQQAHGRYVLHGGNGAKADGHGVVIHEELTDELWQRHLEGTYHLGVMPLRLDGTCRWGAIDIDQYDINHVALDQRLSDLGVSCVVFRTKSGGAHVVVFFIDSISATVLRQQLAKITPLIGYPKAEIFPKQDRLDRDGVGNWLNMPYQGGANSLRYAIGPDGNALTPEEFLEVAANRAMSAVTFTELEFDDVAPAEEDHPDAHLPIPHGSPCLCWYAENDIDSGARNVVLFNFGVYARKSGQENAAEVANAKYAKPPLPARDIRTIARSAARKPYNYQCNEPALAAHCDRATCEKRRFGVKAGVQFRNGSTLRFGQLFRFRQEPPRYVWFINEVRVELSVEDMRSQRLFVNVVTNALGVWVSPMAASEWNRICLSAMLEMKDLDVPDSATRSGRIVGTIREFCTAKHGQSMDELSNGRTFVNDDRVCFMPGAALQYLKDENIMDVNESSLFRTLHDIGIEHGQHYSKGQTIDYWSLPKFKEQIEAFDVPRATNGVGAEE